MKDKYGHEYTDLLLEQGYCLVTWNSRLIPQIYSEVSEYILATNQPAATPNDVHRVYRGQDLVQIILEWPNLSAAYAPILSKVEELI